MILTPPTRRRPAMPGPHATGGGRPSPDGRGEAGQGARPGAGGRALPSARATRRGLLALGVAALAAACARGPAFVEEIDDVAYVPVDPAKAARLLNDYRATSGAGPLTVDPDLVRVAADYARKLAEAGQFTHDLEPWGGLEKRLHAAGYAYATAGENLGLGYRTIEQTIAGWKKSPPHDRGMKDPDMTVMGIASVPSPTKRGQIYWCLIVAKPRGAGAVAGTGPFAPPSGPVIWGARLPSFR
ncbi:CAP domain-containing protein [Siculibacillus lacustris]|uniref:CAP domain-containing protein n=1 Tax=Siculibacillus lacustris TaxID=1549641 RepID=A0A4Q9VJG6_9HYPH|nr:CAP domain-containing protein [Siculibacillus lacustris]TBW35477.1 CAP domain-containing protein [Siculibacillus lacustris]